MFLGSGSGLLDHKPDARDLIFGGNGVATPSRETVFLSNDWRFDQKSLNICVFASAALGASWQEGIRFSVKFYVKLAKKLGMITGNGFSYLRAAREISIKYGRLPYSYMPDDINESWESYSKWDITDEQLAIAAKFKADKYEKIETLDQVFTALEQGYVLFTASQWYSAMNYPQAPEYLLIKSGGVIFGHAWPATGYIAPKNKLQKFRVTNSFGVDWGVKGEAFIKSLFGQSQYAIYVESKLPLEVRRDHFLEVLEGKAVKAGGAEIYLLRDRKKHHITDMPTFEKNFTKFDVIPQDVLDSIEYGGYYS